MTKKKHQELLQRVEDSINSIRPYLITDGGNIEVLEITDDMIVKLRLLGNCEDCPMSEMTMTAGVEEAIKRAVPEIARVEAV
ncbi:MAG TPA: NifU family protein [Chitinophagales bacterium]|nr:NifU family protein [Chitinophagales bacterium]